MDKSWDTRNIPADVPSTRQRFGASTVVKSSHCKIETSPGVYNWSDMDWMVNEIVKSGRQPVYQIGGTPAFYAIDPTSDGVWGPGTNSPYKDLSKLKAFLVAVKTRYPTITGWMGANELNTVRYSTRTAAQAVSEQEALYTTIKTISPTDLIISANCVGGDNAMFGEFLAAGGANYCDAIGYMAYASSWLAPTIRFVQKQMAKYGVAKPLHIIECGVMAGSDEYMLDLPAYTPAEQADFVNGTLCMLRAMKVAEVYWYAWNHEKCGLKQSSGALAAWKGWN